MDCYEGKEVALVISGMGKMASCIATSHLLTKYPEGALVVNLGIAGSTEREILLGTPLLVHKITDLETNRDYYPDILFRHPFLESSLHTCDRPQDSESIIREGLVDMEASGFFEAARVFAPLHRIVVVKVVSDYLEYAIPAKDQVVSWIATQMELIDSTLQNAQKDFAERDILSEDEMLILKGLTEKLRLTRSQQEQLQNLACFHKLQNGTLRMLELVEDMESTDKRSRDEVFERIKALLVQ